MRVIDDMGLGATHFGGKTRPFSADARKVQPGREPPDTSRINVVRPCNKNEPDSRGPGLDKYEDSEKRLRESVSRLEEHFPLEERLGRANERFAEALRLQSKLVDALPFAEKAVALSPFSSGAIRQLGLVHFGLANYDQTEKELRRSFALDPSDALTLRFLGFIPWSRGAPLTNREERKSEFKKVVETFS